MSAWIDFVRKWSAKNRISYKSAMKDPECKKAYAKMKGGALIDDRRREEAERKQMGAEDERPVVRAPAPVRVVSVDEVVEKKPRPAPVRRNTVDVVAKKARPPPVRKNIDPVKVAKLVAQSDLMERGYKAKQGVMESRPREAKERERMGAEDTDAPSPQQIERERMGAEDTDAPDPFAEHAQRYANISDLYQHAVYLIDTDQLGISNARKARMKKLGDALDVLRDQFPNGYEIPEQNIGFVSYYNIGIYEEDGEYLWFLEADDDIKELIQKVTDMTNKIKKPKKPRPAPVRKNEPKPTPYAVKTVFKVPWLRKGVLSYMIPNERQKNIREEEREYGMPYDFVRTYVRLKDMDTVLEDNFQEIRGEPNNYGVLKRKYEKALKKLRRLLNQGYDSEQNFSDSTLQDWGIEFRTWDDDAEPDLVWTRETTKILLENIKEAKDLYEKYR